MKTVDKKPLLIQLLSFGYKTLFTVFTSGGLFLAIFGFSQGEVGVGILGVVCAIFFGMPFYLRANKEMIKNAANVGPLFGDPKEATTRFIETGRAIFYLFVAVAIALVIVMIIGSIIGFVASLPVGVLLTIIILLLLFR